MPVQLAATGCFNLLFLRLTAPLNCSYENRPIDNRQMLVFQQTARQNLSVEEKHYKMKNLKRSASESKRVAPTPPPSEQGGGIVRSHTVSVRDRSLLRKKIETRTQVRVLKNAFLLLRPCHTRQFSLQLATQWCCIASSLCPSPLRARASAVYGLCNKLKFPVQEEVSAQRGQN